VLKVSRASLWGSAAVVACVLAFGPTTALAYNGDNNGHHYGQLKQHHKQPPPNPGPNPAPSPPPAVQPPTSGGGGGSTGTTTGGGSTGTTTGGGSSETRLPTLELSGLAKVRFVTHLRTGDVKFSKVGTSVDAQEEWLALLILPMLIAIWLLLLARGLLAAARRRRKLAEA
jgi:hypothetical protein